MRHNGNHSLSGSGHSVEFASDYLSRALKDSDTDIWYDLIPYEDVIRLVTDKSEKS